MKTERQYCFTNSSGEDIYLLSLRNSNETEVLVTNYGAIITSFKIKRPDGLYNDMVLGFGKVQHYFSQAYLESYPYFGAAIGRYCNRIKNGIFEIDGKKFEVSKNKGNDHLHGGRSGFDKKVWKIVSFDDEPDASLELQYISMDGEEGYPGTLTVSILFQLNELNELSYEYKAVCDMPTAVNLTHHSYFNLNNGKSTIDDHLVKIYADSILDQDENLVANGKYIPVKNSKFDFRELMRIGERWTADVGYDQTYVTDKMTDHLSIVAKAFCKLSKTVLQVYSTEPVVHFYTGKWIPFIPGKNGNFYGPYSGFCFETHKHPNAINISHFPNTVLRPGEKYFQKTLYKVLQE